MTIDRYEMTKETLDIILNNSGEEFRLHHADNGSSDKRVIEYIKSLNPAYQRVSQTNKGIARTLNELIRVSNGDLIVHIGNDIVMTDGWLSRMKEAYETIHGSGIVACHTVEELYQEKEVNGIKIHEGIRVFGPKMFSRKVIKYLGGYNEVYYPYGMEDSDLAVRSHYSGFRNYYVGGVSGKHNGHDCGEDTEYRKMKNDSLKKNSMIYDKNYELYKEGKNLRLKYV
jgi:glycosyltransferase involved in cell wall biosynthesis